jgi:hypothetical protein
MSGLIAPDTELTYNNNEKRTVLLSSTSQWIWDCYNKLIVTANDFAGDDQVVVYHTSEVCHGSTFPDYLYSSWQDHQVAIAVKSLAQLRNIKNLAGLRFCYGSGAHDWGQQAATKAVADEVAAWGYPTACVDHGWEELDGCIIDWAHPGPRASTGIDRGSGPRLYAIRSARSYLERNKRAPDVILRGHTHIRYTELVKVAWGKDGVYVMMSVGAALTGPNEYSHKYNHVEAVTEVGGTLIRVHNGRVVEYQAATWEREDRQRVDGVVAHAYRGSPRS